ncbi:hypothetical protein H6G33_04150 [Calothrix sp. FACHB-1219]|uniref:hypothetical protein n=1 Tax=unclassified Calothrix TaxID=2619626 RepID=UPI0016829573|nr:MULTISPECIES: hypothetical protein [unclassified Calothrix]MBD2204956.1 hypothetical protein [Calothrix sp. FACHB-168]MBD2216220.1 hypothetical protein [Calothrix sp. FACHB-1219]
MASRWLRTNCLASATAAFWLSALSPLPPIGKGISYSLAIVAGVQLVQESKRLMVDDARRKALSAMNEELETVEIALHTQQQEIALQEIYGASEPTYPPEVKEELTQSLEHLYSEPSANHPDELTASTSQKKALYLAVKSLLESQGKTYVIEKVLRVRWAKGEQMLQQILDEGEANGW